MACPQRHFRVDYINAYLQKLDEKLKTPDIKIEHFSFAEKILAFTVTDYLMKSMAENPVGQMKVRIRLMDDLGNSVFDQEKTLTAQKDEMRISLDGFKETKKGEYDFLIDIQDLFTGKEDHFSQRITVEQ